MTDPGDPHKDLGGVLHDVSNALTVLLGWVDEARAPAATPEAVAYALTVIEQRARIARDLARHAIGGPRIDEQREVGLVVSETADALKVSAQRLSVSLGLKGLPVTARVAGSLDLEQVLTNLVLNALAHAPASSTVELGVTVDDTHCSILVADQGPGISASRRDAVFSGDSRRPGGTGVGLRHSRALARAAGGDVSLVDHPGVGARFRVTWPRADAMPRPPVSSSRVAELAGLRLLVVEDDAAVTQLLTAALEARGAAVTAAASKAELEAVATVGPYDAILVDLSPIAYDPPAALGLLRAASPLAAVVLMTGNADALPDAVSTEALELVRKPFEVREVLAVLAKLARKVVSRGT